MFFLRANKSSCGEKSAAFVFFLIEWQKVVLTTSGELVLFVIGE